MKNMFWTNEKLSLMVAWRHHFPFPCPYSPLKIFPIKKNNLFIISQKFQLWNWFDNCAAVGWVSEVPLSSMPRVVGMEQRRTLDFNKSRLSTFYQLCLKQPASQGMQTLSCHHQGHLQGHCQDIRVSFSVTVILIGPAPKYCFFSLQLDLQMRGYPRESFDCCVFMCWCFMLALIHCPCLDQSV